MSFFICLPTLTVVVSMRVTEGGSLVDLDGGFYDIFDEGFVY
jgi:hypothetical protein